MTWDAPDSNAKLPNGWQPSEPDDTPWWKHKLWVLPIWGWGVLIPFAIVALAVMPSPDDDTDPQVDRSYSAHAACADFTRDRLKAPASADFPEYDDPGVSISKSSSVWTVESWVDAENSFGADIRTSFVCVVRDLGSQWRLESWSER